nr:hypothetical protein [Angustibacter aerolatus]
MGRGGGGLPDCRRPGACTASRGSPAASRTSSARLATVPLLRPPSGEVLEIGVLYGLFAAGLHRRSRAPAPSRR